MNKQLSCVIKEDEMVDACTSADCSNEDYCLIITETWEVGESADSSVVVCCLCCCC